MWFENGERYCLLKFKEFNDIVSLALNKSVSLSNSNYKNLFIIWWNLNEENELKFINNYGKEYNIPFNKFKSDVNKYCNIIHKDYLNINIYKNKNLKEIPYCYRDIIYQLHGLWLQKKVKTNFELVVSYIQQKFKTDASKLYGRIYTPYENTPYENTSNGNNSYENTSNENTPYENTSNGNTQNEE